VKTEGKKERCGSGREVTGELFVVIELELQQIELRVKEREVEDEVVTLGNSGGVEGAKVRHGGGSIDGLVELVHLPRVEGEADKGGKGRRRAEKADVAEGEVLELCSGNEVSPGRLKEKGRTHPSSPRSAFPKSCSTRFPRT
jgi:hypothetical protein